MSSASSEVLVLASASLSRRRLLEAAGVPIEVRPVAIDEENVLSSLAAERLKPRDMADALAELKSLRGSRAAPGRLVLGADLLLDCQGKVFMKARDRSEAAEHLRELRGRTHNLWGAACLARNDAVIWRHVGRATLQMRDFSDAFLEDYLSQAGDALLSSVGAFHIEGLGAQLFSRIDGDHFTIQGLPLLPLLEALRTQGALIA
jgi:septum formation protein